MGRWMIIKGGFMMWRSLNICLSVTGSGGLQTRLQDSIVVVMFLSLDREQKPGKETCCDLQACGRHFHVNGGFTCLPPPTPASPCSSLFIPPRPPPSPSSCAALVLVSTPTPPLWNHRQSYFLLSCFLPVVECMSGHSHPPLTISTHVHVSPFPPLFLSLFLLFCLLVPPRLSVSLLTWDRNASSFSLSSWGGLSLRKTRREILSKGD